MLPNSVSYCRAKPFKVLAAAPRPREKGRFRVAISDRPPSPGHFFEVTGKPARCPTTLDAMRWLLERSKSRFYRLRRNIFWGPTRTAALILRRPQGRGCFLRLFFGDRGSRRKMRAPQRTRLGLDLVKASIASMGAKAIVEHGNSSPEPPDSVV